MFKIFKNSDTVNYRVRKFQNWPQISKLATEQNKSQTCGSLWKVPVCCGPTVMLDYIYFLNCMITSPTSGETQSVFLHEMLLKVSYSITIYISPRGMALGYLVKVLVGVHILDIEKY